VTETPIVAQGDTRHAAHRHAGRPATPRTGPWPAPTRSLSEIIEFAAFAPR